MTDTSRIQKPWPGDELVYRVTGDTDQDGFYDSGQRSAREISSILEQVGRPFESFSSILDFGCGCGRILLWLESLAEDAELHGVDIDDRAIEWVSENLPFVAACVNGAEPPLSYEDGSFDLVYNHSVFTHIDERLQDAWLSELRRVTKPGGLVLLTVHGEHAFHHYEEASRLGGGDPSPVRTRFRRDGHVFLQEDPWVGSAFPAWYHTAFHAPWYVFDHWSRYFLLRAFIPRGSLDYQDFVLLERVPDDVATHHDVGPDPAGVSTARPTAAANPQASESPELSAAVKLAAARLSAGPDIGSAATLGPLSRRFRKLVLRALRHHDEHQRSVDEALVSALRALVDTSKAPSDPVDPATGLTLRESNTRLWDALRRTGERVSRFETDMREALRGRGNGTSSAGSDPGQS